MKDPSRSRTLGWAQHPDVVSMHPRPPPAGPDLVWSGPVEEAAAQGHGAAGD